MLRVLVGPAETPEALDPAAILSRLGAEAEEETAVQEVVRDATRIAERIAARRLYFAEYEALIPGTGDSRLFLPVRPIASVSLVQFSTEDPLVEGTEPSEFRIWPRFLYREDTWAPGSPGYTVKWKGGFWLPSMEIGNGSGGEATKPASAESIDVEGRDLRRYVWEIVRANFAVDNVDPTVKRERTGGSLGMEREFRDVEGMRIPTSTLAGLRAFGRRVA